MARLLFLNCCLTMAFFNLGLTAQEIPLTIEYRVDTMWATAYQVTVQLNNQTNQPTESWTASLTLPQENTLSGHVSGGTFSFNGQSVTVTNLSSNGVIAANSNVTFNMIINMPPSGNTAISSLAAVGETSNSVPTEPPSGPPVPSPSTPLNAAYKVDTVRATAFQATVTLKNNASSPFNGWTATFSLPNGFSLSSHVFSGVFSANGPNVTVKNIASNATIAPNAQVTFSMIINMPQGGKAQINNLQATGNGGSTQPLPVPSAPVLELHSTSGTSYALTWESVANAATYTLQEAADLNFSEAHTVLQGNVLTQSFTNKPSGTYFYRVFAANASGNSAYSNPVSITVENSNPIPPSSTIEYSVWYIDWTSWFTGPFVIPSGVNMINIFVGELTYGADGKPTMGGFGTFTIPQLKAFVQFLGEQNPPIQAKVSIGGGGGMYDHTWDKLTSSNIGAFAQGMVDFCHEIGLSGVDFDYEAFASAEQEALVGRLIKEFKLLDPSLQTSLCSNAGFGPNFPWQQSVKNILDSTMIAPGNSALDRFYIMSYYDPMSAEIGWIVGPDGNSGWAGWLIANYGFTRARIAVGIDDFDAHAYDPAVFRAWAISQGFSVAHWAFDPAHPN